MLTIETVLTKARTRVCKSLIITEPLAVLRLISRNPIKKRLVCSSKIRIACSIKLKLEIVVKVHPLK